LKISTAIIPARLASSRLPRKVLADIHGHPLIWHVWNRVSQAKNINNIYIATDSDEVKQVAEDFGANVLMSDPDCQSGTERIASILSQIPGDRILNVQGDEPFVDPAMLEGLINHWNTHPADLITPIFKINTFSELINPNIVKVARTADGHALYFSRSPIPHLRDFPQEEWLAHATFWGHIGVYGYQRSVLEKYYQLPASDLEPLERLEQLRFLEAGYRFQTYVTSYRPLAVDVKDDLDKVREILARGEK
jgi:3-deoxy-manno-octulosonate cytidylyltransferase (CMP-KDO synthetase)